ncbi:hypothetical protein AB0G02_24995 [Actinosynnema sp. NPDC023658]
MTSSDDFSSGTGYGNGLIVYLILEQQKRIVVERVLWLEDLG